MQIELTEQESQALVDLLDLAVKSGGLRVAQNAVALTGKIVEAAKAEQNGKPEEPDGDTGS